MKNFLLLAAVAGLAIGCATAQDNRPAAAAPAASAPAATGGCTPPPKELVIRDTEKGTGDAVAFRTAVLVAYTGWVYDGCAKDFKGEKFDTSDGRPTPFGLMVGAGRVIKGWDEGLIGMQKGGKRTLIIPPEKAYGARSPTPKIPPNSTLVFDLSIVSIVATPPAPAAPKQ